MPGGWGQRRPRWAHRRSWLVARVGFELTADMGLAELPFEIPAAAFGALLEVGEDRVSEIAKEEHVSLAQPRPLLVCQTAEHVEAGVETG
jgi:hypothetical protein